MDAWTFNDAVDFCKDRFSNYDAMIESVSLTTNLDKVRNCNGVKVSQRWWLEKDHDTENCSRKVNELNLLDMGLKIMIELKDARWRSDGVEIGEIFLPIL